MSSADDEFHANKCKRHKSLKNTVENIFDEKKINSVIVLGKLKKHNTHSNI